MTDDLNERLSVLERTVADLVEQASKPAAPGLPSAAHAEVFWALEGLRSRVAETSGAVLYTGVVDLPTGEHYDWQFALHLDEILATDWTEAAPVFNALGHPVRLRLLQKILSGTRGAAELAEDTELGTTGQVYHHLRQLVAAGWLRVPSRGQYAVPGDCVVPLLAILTATR
ncbi:ArsR/SmtB family transcription factor [Actinoplanes regularis]|uniref:Helix-turn-helix domain-containing protein n=1 Tax=Actinoplanes regularis TaxID=52697 RepID=A0A239GS82_9ACTN|nr:winged helix-turn-helix domain-containing protein [Actinoplanes regularis]GIE90843.1 transcriptional regulator [Actinoplanes regularis]SNS71363.1 Helix-turn-helix domain-containing protein [Actinoplanes regularis]